MEILEITANIFTLFGISLAALYGFFRKNRSLIGFRINIFILSLFKLSIITFFAVLIFQLSYNLTYPFCLVIAKGTTNGELWEKGKELHHIFAYFVSIAIGLYALRFVGILIWRGPINVIKQIYKAENLSVIFSNFNIKNELNILSAVYKTHRKEIDVTHILRNMVKNNQLTVTASNALAGDPEWGTPKTLLIKYRFGKEEVQIAEISEDETYTIKFVNYS